MLVLGIESSCDETAVALIEEVEGEVQPRVLSSVISTQIPLHRLYGGVIPELASRNHSTNLPGVLKEALQMQLDMAVYEEMTLTYLPAPPAPVWWPLCWWATLQPKLWLWPPASLLWQSIIWKGTCSPPSSLTRRGLCRIWG